MRYSFPIDGVGQTTDQNGRVLPSVTVSAFLTGTSTAAKMYLASSGGVAVYSMTSDSTDGSYVFYVDDSDYDVTQGFDIVFSKTNFASKTISDVTIMSITVGVGGAGPQGEKGDQGDPGVGLVQKGAWVQHTAYAVADVVVYSAVAYMCFLAIADSATAPGSDTTHFAVIGAAGANGTNGTDGVNAYVYIAYASDASGTGFTQTYSAALNYIAIKTTTTAIPTPLASDFTGLWFNYKGATGEKGDTGDPGTGAVIQVVNYQRGDVVSSAAQIPVDNTKPQISEGAQILTLAITPKSATNKLKIEVLTHCYIGGNNRSTIALFQDSTANALSASVVYDGGGTSEVNNALTYYMTAGTTSSTTFTVRLGGNSSGTWKLNSNASGQLFNGMNISSITITEIKV